MVRPILELVSRSQTTFFLLYSDGKKSIYLSEASNNFASSYCNIFLKYCNNKSNHGSIQFKVSHKILTTRSCIYFPSVSHVVPAKTFLT